MGNFSHYILKHFIFGFLGFWVFFGISSAIAAGDIEAGANKVSMCVGCHGIPNYKTAFPKTYRVPRIAGQKNRLFGFGPKGLQRGPKKSPKHESRGWFNDGSGYC